MKTPRVLTAFSVAGVFAFNSSVTAEEWVVEPVDLEQNSGWSLSIDVSPDGQPAAAFFTTDPNGYQRYAVRTPSGWQEDREVPFNDSFMFDSMGRPHFLSTPASSFYPTLTADGRSYSEPIESTRIAGGTILGFDEFDNPHVAYIDTSDRELRYAAWSGRSWLIQTVASSDSFQFGNSFFVGALDGNGSPHFVFPDGDGLFDQPMTYAKPNGREWSLLPVSASNGSPAEIEFDSEGSLHLAFQKPTRGIVYSVYDGAEWSEQDVTGLSGNVNDVSDLVVDRWGNPHLFVHSIDFGADESFKHVYPEQDGWISDTIDTWTDTSSGPEEIAATISGGKFHVAYATGMQEIYYASRPVPEPTTLGLLATLAGTTAWRRGRQSAFRVGR